MRVDQHGVDLFIPLKSSRLRISRLTTPKHDEPEAAIPTKVNEETSELSLRISLQFESTFPVDPCPALPLKRNKTKAHLFPS